MAGASNFEFRVSSFFEMKIPRKTFEADVPAMAMGDIAFLLLIFFVILAKAVDDSHVKWTPATADELEATAGMRASVAIDRDAIIFLNGREIQAAQLSDALTELLGNLEPGKRTVLLKVDHETKAQNFEPVIEAISVAGGDLVHVLDPEEE